MATLNLKLISSLSFLLLLHVSFAPLPVFSALCNKIDKVALLKIKASFGNPPELASWNSKTGCCSWAGIECDPNTPSGKVVNLTISDANISGHIPAAIGELSMLRYLVLSRIPGLTGPVPSNLGNLSELSQVTIIGTALSGLVPPFFSGLTILNLSSNKLSGAIPKAFGGNAFSTLDLSHNALTGTIPDSLLRGAGNNPDLDLSHNQFTGVIPRAFGDVDFSTINLSGNMLTGDASLLFNESRLTTLIDLSSNILQFDMSSLQFPKELATLDLRHNKISGSIPESITSLAGLQAFNVSYNQLCGKIPTGGQMGRFNASCYANNKCLCGAPLPSCKV